MCLAGGRVRARSLADTCHPAVRPYAQSSEAVVKCILVFVMPLAVVGHLLAARVFFSQLRVQSPSADLSAGPNGAAAALPSLQDYLLPSLIFGSQADDGLNFVSWSTWVNLPPTLFFIAREWPKYWCRKPQLEAADDSRDDGSRVESGGGFGRAMFSRAIAGSVWSRLEPRASEDGGSTNRALGLTFSELERDYRKAGREAEARYAAPDTSELVAMASTSSPR